MDYRVTLTIAAPPLADEQALAGILEHTVDALWRVAPQTGPVMDARIGEPNAAVTLTLSAAT